jgi:uncharacterized membrane protein
MGQDPNQPYSNPYGQPPSGGVPPQGGEYYQGYPQQQQTPPPQGTYPPPPQGAYPPPNTGYQQPYGQPTPGYQQPYGQPGQYNTANPLGPTTINMEPNVAAGLSYLTWVAGLIFFLVEKQNRFVRFHAMQELLLTGAMVIVQIVLSIIFGILGSISFTLAVISTPISSLVWLAAFVLWVICIVNAFQGKYFKLPFIGDYAERWSGASTPRL